MKIPRLQLITLGVADLAASTRFYAEVLGTPPNTSFEGVVFIELPGMWLSLYPLENLARDTGLTASPGAFSGITLAHNVENRQDVAAVVARARAAGARILKEPQDVFWGGHIAYFADPDGHTWEIAWGPMFEFSEQGDLRFKAGE